jgi:putative PIN family toxin of toxin-antitoxin system
MRPRVVLDVEILVGALLCPDGAQGELVRRMVEEQSFELVVSPAILNELREALAAPGLLRHLGVSEEDIERWIAALALLSTHVDTGARNGGRERAEDEYLRAARLGNAHYLITADQDLLRLLEVGGIQITGPRMLLDLLETAREADLVPR